MGIFKKPVVQESAVVPAPAVVPSPSPPTKVPKPSKVIDKELVAEIGVEPVKKTREGRLTAAQWRFAEDLWRKERRFQAVADHFNITVSAVSKRAKKYQWLERLSQDVGANREASKLEIQAKVNAQIKRLEVSDRQALVEAVRAEHLRVGAELIEMGRAALALNPATSAREAVAIMALGFKAQADVINADDKDGAATLTLTLRKQLEEFSVKPTPKKGPQVTVAPAKEGDS